mmetsp:Transcript_30551/g.46284  ORF Transcript_30551/g.46284 Transcript_30551/m.46284 type:complete len:294 (+) Transcript_30551:44-925(+)
MRLLITQEFFLLILLSISCMVIAEPAKVSFINFSETSVKLFWFDEKNNAEHYVHELPPYKDIAIESHIGHKFRYALPGKEVNTFEVIEDSEVHVVGPDTVKVTCESTSGEIHALIKPDWAPRGAGRFLDLVSMGYYNGCALSRVVKKFLTQFGISADFEQRTNFRTRRIQDDTPLEINFRPGFLSFAGSGPDSRTTEIFIVMPGTSSNQIEYFGKNPWETPFGYIVTDDLHNVVDKWYVSGDMPPHGEGPDPRKIYSEDGYDYLKKEFPKLSYLTQCKIAKEEKHPDAVSEEL